MGVGSGALLGLFDEINVGYDDLPRCVIYPKIENKSIDHEMRDVSARRILRVEIRHKKRIGCQLVNSIQHLPLISLT